MALIRDERLVKLVGWKGAVHGKAEKLWRVLKSEKIGFRTRKN